MDNIWSIDSVHELLGWWLETRLSGLNAMDGGVSHMHKVLRCHAEGRDGDWEAFCLDLDIAVPGRSFEDVFRALNEAIALHVEAVAALPETVP